MIENVSQKELDCDFPFDFDWWTIWRFDRLQRFMNLYSINGCIC